MAKLGVFIHYCTEKHCGGIVLEDMGRVKKMQKVSLTVGECIRTFNDEESARRWATQRNIVIEETN